MVNVYRILASQTSFGQENPNFVQITLPLKFRDTKGAEFGVSTFCSTSIIKATQD